MASVEEGRRKPLDYASPPRKVKKPLPDVAFLLGWMALLVALFVLTTLVLVAVLEALPFVFAVTS